MEIEAIKEYEESLQQLIANPKSPRLFNEVFTGGLDILQESGLGFQFWSLGSKKFGHKLDGPGDYNNIELKHKRGFYKWDDLKVSYFRHDLYNAELSLTRFRGNELLNIIVL